MQKSDIASYCAVYERVKKHIEWATNMPFDEKKTFMDFDADFDSVVIKFRVLIDSFSDAWCNGTIKMSIEEFCKD